MSSGYSYHRPMDQQQRWLHREATRRPGRPTMLALVIDGPSRRRALLVAPAIIGLTLVMAACGGGSPKAGIARLGPTSTAAATGATANGSPAANGDPVRYASCMRSHGVMNFPDPNSPDPAGVVTGVKQESGSPAFQAAAKACASYAYHGTPPPRVSPQEIEKLLAVARCMRAHGISNFPDPNPTTGDMAPPADISRTSPIVLAALRACHPEAQAAGLGPPNTGQ